METRTFIGYVNFQQRFFKDIVYTLLPLYVLIGFIVIRGFETLDIFGVTLYSLVLAFPTYEYLRFCKPYLCDIEIDSHKQFKASYYKYNTLERQLDIPIHELQFTVQKIWWAPFNSFELVIYHREQKIITQRTFGEWSKTEFDELLAMVSYAKRTPMIP